MQNKRAETILRFRKIAIVLLAGLLLLSALTGLASCGVGTTTVKLETVTESEKISPLSKNIASNTTARMYFTAAINGYNMLEEGFDDNNLEAMRAEADSKYYTADEEGNAIVNLKAVKAILLHEKGEGQDAWTVCPDANSESYKQIVEGLTEAEILDIHKAMQTSVNLENSGWWDTAMRGIGTAIRWVSDHIAFGNYLLTLFLFALIIELLMLPLGVKQQKNSIKQAKLRPKEMAIRKKYAGRNDQATMQKMQQEIQELYQRENFNQFGGCLPLLISLPVLMILYWIVIDPLHYMLGLSSNVSGALSTYVTAAKAAGGMGLTFESTRGGTIEILSVIKDHGTEFVEGLRSFSYFSNSGDLANAVVSVENSLPNFNIGPVNFGLVPRFGTPWALVAVPVLTFLVYFGSMKLTRKFTYQPPQAADVAANGCSNSVMDLMMPLFSVYIAFQVPAVVGCYWIFKSLFSTLKQFILVHLMPYPKFTDEDYKAAEKALGGKAPKPQKKYSGGTGNPRVRSLHHIDDEDFEDTRAKAEKRKQALEELDEIDRPKAPKEPSATREEIEKARLKLGRNEEAKKRHQEETDGDNRGTEEKQEASEKKDKES